MTEQTHDHERWHLKKEIQLGHLITTIVVATSAMWYVAKLEQRIAIIETQVVVQRERDSLQDLHFAEGQRDVKAHLERMESKLDRLIERRGGQQ